MNWSQAPYINDLVHWIVEREQVRIRKECDKPKPWSQDPILQTTRFCNVRREDDKVTKWLRKNWFDPHALHPNLAFSACLARVVNWPATLEQLGFPLTWSPKEFIETMGRLSANGSQKIWGGAYMVTGGYSAGGETKQVIMARVLDNAYANCAELTHMRQSGFLHTLEEAYDFVQQTPGLGSFLAAQVIADLKYTPLLLGTPDWVTFCAPGPGSTMGLNFLAGRPPTKSIPQKQFVQEVNDLRTWLADNQIADLTAHDTQNCLCEFSKYVRIKYKGGRAKTRYQGV